MLERWISRWVRADAAAFLVLTLWAVTRTDSSWIWFLALFLVPDLSMVGYVFGPRVGATTYNVGHLYAWPVALLAAGLTWHAPLATTAALSWIAHIAFDNVVGYGLKLPIAFEHTMYGPIGSRRLQKLILGKTSRFGQGPEGRSPVLPHDFAAHENPPDQMILSAAAHAESRSSFQQGHPQYQWRQPGRSFQEGAGAADRGRYPRIISDTLLMPVPRILIADDQADILQALRLLLTDSGFETDLVASVDGVLDRLSGEPYDLLLMDLNYSRDTTSGREGLDLLERVRARDPLLPVVVMTGWGSIETAVEAMRRCAKSFVQKPWDNVTLVRRAGPSRARTCLNGAMALTIGRIRRRFGRMARLAGPQAIEPDLHARRERERRRHRRNRSRIIERHVRDGPRFRSHGDGSRPARAH
jgi:FixJ family two-component response regulator